MPYKANLIRASNGNGVAAGPSNYNRSSDCQLLQRLPPGYVYYCVEQDLQVQTSIFDGAIVGYEQRLSAETLSTLYELVRKAKRGRNFDRIISVFFDKRSPGFEWLTDGWLGEKRILAENSHKWLYYDPSGRQYRSKRQVLRFWKEQECYTPTNGKEIEAEAKMG